MLSRWLDQKGWLSEIDILRRAKTCLVERAAKSHFQRKNLSFKGSLAFHIENHKLDWYLGDALSHLKVKE